MVREDLDRADPASVLVGLRVDRPELLGSVAEEALEEAAVSAGEVAEALADAAAGAVRVSEIGPDAGAIRMLPEVPVLSSAIAVIADGKPCMGWSSCRFAIQLWTHGHSR